jgi:hypothetical protein
MRELGGIPDPDLPIFINDLVITGTRKFKAEKTEEGWRLILFD